MPLVSRFDTPGSLRDAPDGSPFYDAWHRRVAGILKTRTPGAGAGEFVDPTEVDLVVEHDVPFSWIGFPRPHLLGEHRDAREAAFAAGEDRLAQHEYLEWHVTRDGDGKIAKVTFTTETPEYWEELARTEPDLVVALYRQLVDPAVRRQDLFDAAGRYVRDNPWNHERGIVHYIMGINGIAPLLNAEQDTPVRAGVTDNLGGLPLAFANGTLLLTAADARFSLDLAVRSRQGLSLTVREPVGLTMVDWDDTGWARPDGRPVGDWWRVVRGAPGAALRLEYQVPASEGFVVGDLTIGGRPVRWGGQLAEHVAVQAACVAGRRA